MWNAFSSSGLRSTRRAGLPSRSSASARLTRSSVSLGLLRVLVAALGLLLQRVDALLQAVEIGQHQLGLDRLDVGDRIDAALDVGDVVVLEAAHHMRDGVDLADVGEELVAEALALGGAAHQPGDVDEGQPRRHDLRRTWRAARARRAADRAPPPRRHSARWCRTDSSPPAPPRSAVSALKSVDLPTFGRPTMPHLKPMMSLVLDARSRRVSPDRPASFGSPKPLACMARCTLFWKLASWPFASSSALSAMMSHSASTQSRSSLAKSLST